MADFMGARQGGFSGQDDDSNQIINGTPSAFLPFASHSSSPSHGIYPQYQSHYHHRGLQEFSWGWAPTQQGSGAGHGCRRHREDHNEDGNPDRDESGEESGGGGGGVVVVQRREHMFDKVVTPSDVGKLNRLVIPKQHAERYFPLDSTANEKGLLLNFEDRGGKPWRFRYSYWNSSQSYVMTKGWSRFVKEKRLDAGDIVSFHRGVDEASKDRLYIDWRRRPDASGPSSAFPHPPRNNFTPFARSLASGTAASYFPPPPIWNSATPFLVAAPATTARVWDHTAKTGHSYYASCGAGGGSSGWYGYDDSLAKAWSGCSGPPVYQVMNYMRSGETLRPQADAQAQAQAQEQELGGEELKSLLPMVQGTPSTGGTAAAGKRLRLFGVNMDCAVSSSSQSSDQDEECDPASPSISNTTTAVHANRCYHHHYHHHLSQFPSMSTSRITAGTMEMDSPPLHIPLHLSLYDDATPVLHLNKSKAPASSSTLDFDV